MRPGSAKANAGIAIRRDVRIEVKWIGRGERIRTSDSCVPNAVLYQAELRPDRGDNCANCS